jgi:hypothetical protein
VQESAKERKRVRKGLKEKGICRNIEERLNVEVAQALPPVILERYDSIEVRGWGSANDMIPEELGRRGSGRRLKRERTSTSDRRAPVREDGEVADKGRRSFLRHAERLEEA